VFGLQAGQAVGHRVGAPGAVGIEFLHRCFP
jgi:hypothetical protein